MEDVKYSLFAPDIQLGEEDMQARRRMLEMPNYGGSANEDWDHHFLDALQESVTAQQDSTRAVENMNHELAVAVEKISHMEDAVVTISHVEDAVAKMSHEVEDAVGKISHVEDAVEKISHRLDDMEIQLDARLEGLEKLIRGELMALLRVVEKKSSSSGM